MRVRYGMELQVACQAIKRSPNPDSLNFFFDAELTTT